MSARKSDRNLPAGSSTPSLGGIFLVHPNHLINTIHPIIFLVKSILSKYKKGTIGVHYGVWKNEK